MHMQTFTITVIIFIAIIISVLVYAYIGLVFSKKQDFDNPSREEYEAIVKEIDYVHSMRARLRFKELYDECNIKYRPVVDKRHK